MTRPSYMDRVNTAAMRVHGESVTLADTSEIRAVFALNNPPGWGYGADLAGAIDQQPQPTLQILAADAETHRAQLSPGATIRMTLPYPVGPLGWLAGVESTAIIAEPPEPDGYGLVTVRLMPQQAQDVDASAGARRWR